MAMLGVSGVDRNAEVGIAPEPRLLRAAHQFEAMMMKELLAPMSRGNALFDDSNGEETGVLGQFASESLAGALSAGGGLGIADRIVHALSRSGNPSASAPVTGKPGTDTGISARK
jgi:Rod binding domain-containing protein